ncbi:hypothetical protein SAMN05216212_1242 [Microbulbifer yueqingensis]|uniref:Uncharacterized protein n=1 Tax=Microbulbifer yueqingensis TaxID=658219 RepID=A0A1G8XUF1_9GAMM|nr:hypothetical protein SAMN05216212_1242 [Microbulbifer yueqingensis]
MAGPLFTDAESRLAAHDLVAWREACPGSGMHC